MVFALRYGEAMMSFTTIIIPLIIKTDLREIKLMKCGSTTCLNAKKMKLRFGISHRLFSLVYQDCVRYFFQWIC